MVREAASGFGPKRRRMALPSSRSEKPDVFGSEEQERPATASSAGSGGGKLSPRVAADLRVRLRSTTRRKRRPDGDTADLTTTSVTGRLLSERRWRAGGSEGVSHKEKHIQHDNNTMDA